MERRREGLCFKYPLYYPATAKLEYYRYEAPGRFFVPLFGCAEEKREKGERGKGKNFQTASCHSFRLLKNEFMS